MIYKFLDWFLWGIFMGMGWAIAQNVLHFIGTFIHWGNTMAKAKWTKKSDEKDDKKKGIKLGSKKDKKLDKKRGLKD